MSYNPVPAHEADAKPEEEPVTKSLGLLKAREVLPFDAMLHRRHGTAGNPPDLPLTPMQTLLEIRVIMAPLKHVDFRHPKPCLAAVYST